MPVSETLDLCANPERRLGRRTPDGGSGTLDTLVEALLGEPDLDGFLAGPDGRLEGLVAALPATLQAGFAARDPGTLLAAHKALYRLYEENLRTPEGGAGVNQFHPFIMQIRRTIETAWERHECGRIDLRRDDIPATASAFAQYFKERCAAHRLSRHPLFDYLEYYAPRRQVIEFFLHDSVLISRFIDLIALSMVGAHDEVRLELAVNFWDEMGRGRPDARHKMQFRRLLRYAGVDGTDEELAPGRFVDHLDWRGLAGYNLYLFLLLHRRNYYRSMGNIGSGELMDPPQVVRVVKACHRVGLDDDEALAYYVGHIEADTFHGDGWIANVMIPLLTRSPEARFDMVLGAEMRMNTAADYYDFLLEKLGGAEAASPWSASEWRSAPQTVRARAR